jgi:UDP-galactopyranose mutase
MFKKMLNSFNIQIQLNTNAKDVIRLDQSKFKVYFNGEEFQGDLIYTGPVDELFDYRLGQLPYRSLQFVTKTHNVPIFQPTTTVNYPNTEDYTRITEFNHMMKNPNKFKTTIMYEYPQNYDKDDPLMDIPYYPIPKNSSTKLYVKYKSLAEKFQNLHLVGRLAEYRYYDMNDIIIRALQMFDSMSQHV